MTRISSPRRKTPVTRFIIPLITVGILAALWRFNLKWGTIPVILFLIFYYGFLPKITVAASARFNRKAVLLLTRGKAAEIPNLVKRSLFFQLIAPKGVLEAKLALAYLECEQFPTALRCFEASVPYAPAQERSALLLGMIKALFVTGDFSRAEVEAADVIRNITKLPELLAIAARCRVGLGKIDNETARLLDEAEKLSPNDDTALMIALTRIESALRTGRKPAASLPEGADSDRKLLRAWIHLVRGLLREHRGDNAKALKSFEKAASTLPESFIFAEAKKHSEALMKQTEPSSDAAAAFQDAALRKKKRKRR